jgi:hypothetical protein
MMDELCVLFFLVVILLFLLLTWEMQWVWLCGFYMQPIWDAVLRFDPDLFIWLGDNIYADSKKPLKFTGKGRNSGPWKNTPRFFQVTAAEMEHQYQLMKNVSGYVKLREQTEVCSPKKDSKHLGSSSSSGLFSFSCFRTVKRVQGCQCSCGFSFCR